MFWETCPKFLAMGMTYEQFWDESPYLAVVYKKAHKLKRELDNEQAWLQGLYVCDAIAVCLSNAFKKRGGKTIQYLEQPIDIFPLSKKEKKRREQQEYAKMQAALEAMARKQRAEKQKGDV